MKNKLIDLLSVLRAIKFVTSLVLEFKKQKMMMKQKYSSFYLICKEETIVDKRNTDNLFEAICVTIILNIKKFLEKVLAGLLIQI